MPSNLTPRRDQQAPPLGGGAWRDRFRGGRRVTAVSVSGSDTPEPQLSHRAHAVRPAAGEACAEQHIEGRAPFLLHRGAGMISSDSAIEILPPPLGSLEERERRLIDA